MGLSFDLKRKPVDWSAISVDPPEQEIYIRKLTLGEMNNVLRLLPKSSKDAELSLSPEAVAAALYYGLCDEQGNRLWQDVKAAKKSVLDMPADVAAALVEQIFSFNAPGKDTIAADF